MRKFATLAATCSDEVCKALRALWEATYEFAHKDWLFSKSTPEDKAQYEARKAELMEIIQPDADALPMAA